jgi:hypothetical protein
MTTIVPRFARHDRRRGFAIIIAIGLMGLVAAALALLATMMAADTRRTSSAVTEAQLRQLLVAGAAVAQRDIQGIVAAGEKGRAITLPEPLSQPGGKLTLTAKSSGDRAEVEVLAAYERRHAAQMLTFERKDGAWQMVSARLEQ